MKKNAEIRIKLSTNDKMKLQEKAEAHGLSLSSFCLLGLLSVKRLNFIEQEEMIVMIDMRIGF